MKSTIKILLAACVVAFASCGTMQHTQSSKMTTRLEVNMDDLQYLGEMEISCEYDTYLGFIRHYTSINGQAYDPRDKQQLTISGGLLNFHSKGMNLAAMKVLERYPEATYFQVVLDTKQTDVLFLGANTKRTAKVRAYKFK